MGGLKPEKAKELLEKQKAFLREIRPFRVIVAVPDSYSSPGAKAYFTTSNALEGTRDRVARSSSLQRGSGAPLTYQPEPLSATNIP